MIIGVLHLFMCGLLASTVDAAINGWSSPTISSIKGSATHPTSIPENTQPSDSTGVEITATSDVTTGTAPTINYALINQPALPLFAIGKTTGDVSITAALSLDYETTKSYVIEVTAKEDSETDAATATATITLNVGNIGPLFEKSSETVCVQQGTLEGTDIITITATLQEAGTISYSFTPAHELFEIGPNTGVVTVKMGQSLDQAESYTLTVQATADNDPATMELNINVGDCSSASMVTPLSLVMLLVSLLVSMN